MLGTNRDGAIAHLGCSESMFERLTREGKIKPVRKGWYSYRLLDEQMRAIERSIMPEHEGMESQGKGPVRGNGAESRRKTQDILRAIPGGRQ